MQAGVFAFIVVDMDGDILDEAELPAVGSFESLEVGSKDVVRIADRHALGEFPVMVGIHFPADFVGLVLAATNLDRNAIDWMVVRSPYGASNESVIILGLLCEQRLMRTDIRQQKQRDQGCAEGWEASFSGTARRKPRSMGTSNHCLRFLLRLLPRPLRSLLRPPSTRAGWW